MSIISNAFHTNDKSSATVKKKIYKKKEAEEV